MKLSLFRHATAALIAATGAGGRATAATTSLPDWPLYRHDTALSGVSPGRGRIERPEIRWEYYLGAPSTSLAADRSAPASDLADLDGDGTLERFKLSGKTIEVTDLNGKLLWSFTVDGFPLGGQVRVCKLFPHAKGQQIISFSSRMDNGQGQGYAFRFDQGAHQGRLAWTTGPLSSYHSPTLILDDVDGDGLLDIVTAPHYRLQIFNGQSGALKAEVTVAKGRNYGILLSRPRRDGPQKDLYIISDFVLHVECVRFQNGQWVHAWGHKYLADENAARPKGRQEYIRVGPNPVCDLDGDGQDELAYMLVNGAEDDQWHLIVRDVRTGAVKGDLAGVWLWSIADLDGDRVPELIYTPTKEKRPPTYCQLHVGHLAGGKISDLATLKGVRPILMNATLPPTANSIADEGLVDILRADLQSDGKPEFFYATQNKTARVEDALGAVSLGTRGKLERQWEFARRGHQLDLVQAGPDELSVRDLTAATILAVDGRGNVVRQSKLGAPGGFTTLPIVVDLDQDGRNDIVLQNASGQIVALKPGNKPGDSAFILWSVPGVAMNLSPGYAPNGALCPQAADLDGDGRTEILFAAEDERGRASLVCVNGRGKVQWRRAIDGCPWGGLQAGVDHWTFGRFTGRKRGLDVYVDLHRRSKGSGEGWVLRGDNGAVVWKQDGLVAQESAMPFGGGIPAVADLDGDGADDLAQMFFTIYGVSSGRTGNPVFPPAFLLGKPHFGKWLAYSEPTAADLNGDGKLDVYLNSRSYARGGYAAVHADGTPLWAEFHDNDEGSDGLGPVGDFDGDGQLEIGVPVLNGTLLCLNARDGSHKWRIQTPVTGDVVAADINSDGIQELLFAARDGKIHAVSGRDGREVWSIPASGRPIAADVDGDGLIEVIAVGQDGFLRIIGNAR